MLVYVRTTTDSRRARRLPERRRRASALLLAALALPLATRAQTAASDSTASRFRVVAAGPEYGAGPVKRLLFGPHYRQLWTTPLRVPVLDLATYRGGVTPLKAGGSKQTRSLRFRSRDGAELVFRSVNKEPVLPPELQRTVAQQIARDQTSALLPGGALIVAPLSRATGVLHADPVLVVLPDDPLLGEFRGEFAGVLGLIEERPTADADEGVAFAGAREVASTDKFLEHLERGSRFRVDSRQYLAARLLDILVGDSDRHEDQWRWALLGDGDSATWRPVPRDRDFAFIRMDGFLPRLARSRFPRLVNFRGRYPDIYALVSSASALDRRLLTDLERPVWDSVAAGLQTRITDSVIAHAVRQLPPEYIARVGRSLERALRLRRDRLGDITGRFYRLLAESPEIHGSARSDRAEVTRRHGGRVEVRLSRCGDAREQGCAPSFQRTFEAAETRELRLYLGGGDDTAVVRGRARPGMIVRVIGGEGDDVLLDSTAAGRGGTHLYDAEGRNQFGASRGTVVDRRPWSPPPRGEVLDQRPRDWGHLWLVTPWVDYSPDAGLVVGARRELQRYGFRQHPYASRTVFGAAYATGARGVRLEYGAEFRRPNSGVRGTLLLRASQLEVLRFHGIGNEVPAREPSAFYKVEHVQLRAEPAVSIPLSPRTTASLGATAQYLDADLAPGRFISTARPYGAGSFGQIGGRATLTVDTRDRAAAATRGVLLSAEGSAFPAVWDVRRAFGELHAQAATYLSAPIRAEPTLALRAGGRRVWGTYPFHEAAYIGGASTVRGWRERRFAGDAALYGNAELRLFLTKFFLVFPGDLGVFALADGGRVFVSGESSSAWHTAAGGGIWFAFLKRANTVSFAVARGRERTGVYLRSGFLF